MKKINFYIMAFLAVLTIGCTDDDKLAIDVEDLETGAFLRTIDLESGTFDFFNLSDSEFSVVLEGDDGQNGALIESVDLYVNFTDRSPDNDGPGNVSEVLLRNIPASQFTDGPNGLPRLTVKVTASEAASALGISLDEIGAGDTFDVRTALNLTTGQTFSSTNAGTNLTGSFFNSPFRYRVGVVCPSNLQDISFSWVATDFFFQGGAEDIGPASGTDKLIASTPTTYTYESGFFDFGYYCLFYDGADPGCGSGAAGSLKLSDTCGKLSYQGADQYGDPWTITDVSVDGPVLQFTWESAYGEKSTVTLTRTDGMDWPDNLK